MDEGTVLTFVTERGGFVVGRGAGAVVAEHIVEWCKLHGTYTRKDGPATVYDVTEEFCNFIDSIQLCGCGHPSCPANMMEKIMKAEVRAWRGKKIYIINKQPSGETMPVLNKLVRYLNEGMDFGFAQHLLTIQYTEATDEEVAKAKKNYY